MDLLPLFYRISTTKKLYNKEKVDHESIYANVGGEGFAESFD